MAHVRRREQYRSPGRHAAAPAPALVQRVPTPRRYNNSNDPNDDDMSTMTSKRRSMALLKYGSSGKSSSRQTRAHAREIAQTLSKDLTSSEDAFFADFGSAFGGSNSPATTSTRQPQSKPRQQQQSQQQNGFAEFGSSVAATTTTTPQRKSRGVTQVVATPTPSRRSSRRRSLGGQQSPGLQAAQRHQQQDASSEVSFTTAWPDDNDNFSSAAASQQTHNTTNSTPRRGSTRRRTPQRSTSLRQKLESSSPATHNNNNSHPQHPTAGSVVSAASSSSGSQALLQRRQRRRNQDTVSAASAATDNHGTSWDAAGLGSPQSSQQRRRLANHVANYATSKQSYALQQQPQRAPSVSSNTTTHSMSSNGSSEQQQHLNSGNNNNLQQQQNANMHSSTGFTFDAFGLDAKEFTQVADITDDIGDFALWDDDEDATNTSRSSSHHQLSESIHSVASTSSAASQQQHKRQQHPQQTPPQQHRSPAAHPKQQQQQPLVVAAHKSPVRHVHNSTNSNSMRQSSSHPQIYVSSPSAAGTANKQQHDQQIFEDDQETESESSSLEEESAPSSSYPVRDDVLASHSHSSSHSDGHQRGGESAAEVSRDDQYRQSQQRQNRAQTSTQNNHSNATQNVVATSRQATSATAGASRHDDGAEQRQTQASDSRRADVRSWSSRQHQQSHRPMNAEQQPHQQRSFEEAEPVEEKKEEDVTPPKVGSLKARFEQQNQQTSFTPTPQPFSKTRPLPRLEIQSLEDKLGEELLSPEKIAEQKKQEKQQRLASIRQSYNSPSDSPRASSISKHPANNYNRARSEGGAAIRHQHVSNVMRNLQPQPPPAPSHRYVDTGPSSAKSDVGVSSPTSPFGITLRKTKNSPTNMAAQLNSSSPARELPRELPFANHHEEACEQQHREPEKIREVPQRKMSYRERRELELQQQQGAESSVSAQESQPDVRELIRNRIAANKQRLSSSSTEKAPEQQEARDGGDTYAIQNSPSYERAGSPQPLTPRRLRQSELIIEKDESGSCSASEAVAQPSAAVSHMLMLQQLQQKQPTGSPARSHASSAPHNQVAAASAATASPVRSRASLSVDVEADRQSRASTGKTTTPKATMMMLNAFLAGRGAVASAEKGEDRAAVIDFDKGNSPKATDGAPSAAAGPSSLKDDPTYERYFKMLKVGMPMEVVKHAMVRDGLDPNVMDGDGDGDKAGNVPLKDDPTYQKYFKMLKIGMPMEAVKHAMQRDGLDSSVMDQDHSLPVAQAGKSTQEAPKEKDSHRRARLHWKTVRKVTSNSLWAQIDADEALDTLDIDEAEFQELFQAEKGAMAAPKANASTTDKRGASVRVIDPKRANNGGIILARLKMSHDDMADAVDRINENALTAEQIENIIEYLPTKEERKALEAYMLGGGQDAGEKFESLCECEKFMVSMMTVKHAKQKVRALLFRMQFETCIQDIQQDTLSVEAACDELQNSGRMRKLLGYILTFGNRLNTAGNGKRKAGAFTLDSLLKLNQAKAFDKKTTFLQYIVQIVLRNAEDVTHFKDDLPNVFKADRVYWDQCLTDLEELENQLENVRRISLYQARQAQQMYRIRRKKNRDDENEELSEGEISLTLEEEVESLRATPIGVFTLSAIKYVSAMRDKVEETRAKFSGLLEYFGEENEQMQPHEVFSVIVAFSRDYDKAKEQVLANEKRKMRDKKKAATGSVRKGKPPMHSTHAPAERPIRASNHQPSMGSILKELKARPSSPAPEPVEKPRHHRQQSSGDAQPGSPVENSEYQAYSTPDRRKSRPSVPHASSVGDDRPTPRKLVDESPVRHAPQRAVTRTPSGGTKSAEHPPPETAPANLVPVTPRSMAAVRAKARMRRNRAAPPPKEAAAPRHADDASTDSPLSPRSSIRHRRRMQIKHSSSQSSSGSTGHLEQALELD